MPARKNVQTVGILVYTFGGYMEGFYIALLLPPHYVIKHLSCAQWLGIAC
jgi:hypothetical protein